MLKGFVQSLIVDSSDTYAKRYIDILVSLYLPHINDITKVKKFIQDDETELKELKEIEDEFTYSAPLEFDKSFLIEKENIDYTIKNSSGTTVETSDLKQIIKSYKEIIKTPSLNILKGGAIERNNHMILENFIKLTTYFQTLAYQLDRYKALVTTYLKDVQLILTTFIEFDIYLEERNKLLKEIKDGKITIKPSYKFSEIKMKFEEYKQKYDSTVSTVSTQAVPNKDLELIFTITSGIYYGIKKDMENKKIKEEDGIVVIDFGRKYTNLSLLFLIAKLF
jgi:hypothetical protein